MAAQLHVQRLEERTVPAAPFSEFKLTPSELGANDNHGFATAIDGDTAVVGSAYDENFTGSVFVYTRTGTTWTQQAKLTASNGVEGNRFGFSVAIDDDTIVVGANGPQENNQSPGAAYVFVRSGTTWTEQQALLASDGAAGDRFGAKLGVAGDTIVIGAPSVDTSAGENVGAGYVFERSGTTWTETQKLLADDGAANDTMGFDVGISGDTVVLGAQYADLPNASNGGVAYVFARSTTGTFTQQAKLVGSQVGPDDNFGYALAIDGDTVVLASNYADTDAGVDAGAAFIFERTGTTWTQTQRLVPSDTADTGLFGFRATISGNRMLIAQGGFFNLDETTGAAYLFERGASGWTQSAKFTPADLATGDAFYSVALNGSTAVVGSFRADVNGLVDAGAAYAFELASTPLTSVASGADGGSRVVVYNADNSVRTTLTAFPGATTALTTTTGDVNGDGIDDIIVGSGPGGGPAVKVFDGKTNAVLMTFFAYDADFTGGIFVAAGDFNADGRADIVTSPDEGGGPRVRIFSGANPTTILGDFFGITDSAFRGGARISVGDLTRDGVPDLAVGAGVGGGPRVALFDGRTLASPQPTKLVGDFFLFEPGLRNGVYVALGDLNRDGYADLVAGAGPGGGPRVFALDGQALVTTNGAPRTQLANFFAGDTTARAGIRVAVKPLPGTLDTVLVVGAGVGSGPRVTSYRSDTIAVNGPRRC